MRKVLFVIALLIFLYCPWGPNWGRDAVNLFLAACLFSYLGKNILRRNRYYDD